MKPINIAQKKITLEQVLAESWAMVAHAITEPAHPFRTPVLGTTGPHGCNLRTVVLRRVIEPERLLICHTDLRSSKIHDLRQQPRLSWLFYHPQEKIQLRFDGQATLHTDDDLADEQWVACNLMSRRIYRTLNVPGTPLSGPASGLPESLITRAPTPAESEAGRKNFAVIACKVDFIDWLFLNSEGNWRAQFRWANDKLTATWIVP